MIFFVHERHCDGCIWIGNNNKKYFNVKEVAMIKSYFTKKYPDVNLITLTWQIGNYGNDNAPPDGLNAEETMAKSPA